MNPQKQIDSNQLARAYVPFQIMEDIYSPKEALCNGTLFPELNFPNKKNRLILED